MPGLKNGLYSHFALFVRPLGFGGLDSGEVGISEYLKHNVPMDK